MPSGPSSTMVGKFPSMRKLLEKMGFLSRVRSAPRRRASRRRPRRRRHDYEPSMMLPMARCWGMVSSMAAGFGVAWDVGETGSHVFGERAALWLSAAKVAMDLDDWAEYRFATIKNVIIGTRKKIWFAPR